MASIAFNDDSAVVIIGSGAGGGTLANELCQKGIKVVVLEAGARQSPQSFVKYLTWSNRLDGYGTESVSVRGDARYKMPWSRLQLA